MPDLLRQFHSRIVGERRGLQVKVRRLFRRVTGAGAGV